jgi:hypothetical protein
VRTRQIAALISLTNHLLAVTPPGLLSQFENRTEIIALRLARWVFAAALRAPAVRGDLPREARG